MDAEYDSDPETVYLLKDGKRYRIPFKNLSQADQKYVTRVRSSRGNGGEGNRKAVSPGKRYALLIGVNRYAKPIKSLQFCVKDMELLADCFEKTGIPKENIFLVTDDSPFELRPTGGVIRRQVETITSLAGPNDQLIVAFSGHGAMVNGESYLCPSDTDLKDKNSIVSRDWVFEKLEKCRAKQKVFIIDACRDEISFNGGKAVEGAHTLDDPFGADTHGFILISSCDKKQQSWEHPEIQHGVFTYFLAQGLSGEARNDRGYVSIIGLFQYASSKTRSFVYRKFNMVQVPMFRQGGEMTDFYLAKVDRPFRPGDFLIKPFPTEQLKAGDKHVIKVNGVDFTFRYCPPGMFMMGSPTSEAERLDEEKQHKVTLTKGFWILETEVTVAMYKAYIDDIRYESDVETDYSWQESDSQDSWLNPGFHQDDDHPVTNVSWSEAAGFCQWLSKKSGLNFTLPTETQWEYACRAGTTGAYAGVLDEMAWYNDNNGKTHPVGKKKPNAWGLYDMHGNVWEWCLDCMADYPSVATDPIAASYGSQRVLRGGGWNSLAGFCRSAFRFNNDPRNRNNNQGFRCVTGQSRQ